MPITCAECGVIKINVEEFEHHAKLEHLNWWPYQCGACPTRRTTLKGVREHALSNHRQIDAQFIFHDDVSASEKFVACFEASIAQSQGLEWTQFLEVGISDLLETAPTPTLPREASEPPPATAPSVVQQKRRHTFAGESRDQLEEGSSPKLPRAEEATAAIQASQSFGSPAAESDCSPVQQQQLLPRRLVCRRSSVDSGKKASAFNPTCVVCAVPVGTGHKADHIHRHLFNMQLYRFECTLCDFKSTQAAKMRIHYDKKHNTLTQSENMVDQFDFDHYKSMYREMAGKCFP